MSNTLNNVILHLEGINCRLELEVVSKPQIRLKSKAQADPPSLKKLWRDR
jgi:hypothetical protein